jgi:dephospho-CoA kinase
MLIGITGKSGSGKTTAAKWMANNMEYFLIDVDEVGHKILDIPEVQAKIKEAFGVEVSSTNRKALGDVVFNNREKMKEYADMTFKLMCDEIDKLIDTHPNCIIEWILLPKTKYFNQCDIKILCKRSYEKRLNDVMERDGITQEYFETREKNSIEYDEEKFDKIIIINR